MQASPPETRSARARSAWSKVVGAVDGLVFPLACRICEQDGLLTPFCDLCRAELLGASAGACVRCAMPVGPFGDRDGGCSECRGRSLGFDSALVLGPYTGPIRSLCLDLKVESNAWLARWASGLVADAHDGALRGLQAARVVPVPLHWSRRLRRGYDQADALARPLAKRLNLPVSRALRRVKATPRLAGLGKTARAATMHKAFVNRRTRSLEGQTVILVDDILTTGATSGAAARALKAAGARRVVLVAIGRAEGGA